MNQSKNEFNWEERFDKLFVSNGYISSEDGDLFEAKEIKQFIVDLIKEAEERGYKRGYSLWKNDVDNILSVLIDKNGGELRINDRDIATSKKGIITNEYDYQNGCFRIKKTTVAKDWIEIGEGYERLYPQNQKFEDDEKYDDCHYPDSEETITITEHIFDKDGFCINCGNTREQCKIK